MHVHAEHDLELTDGHVVTLLQDRGFAVTAPWRSITVHDLEVAGRSAVGPDEPFDDATAEDMARDYWVYLARLAADRNIEVTPRALSSARHDVILTPRLIRLLE